MLKKWKRVQQDLKLKMIIPGKPTLLNTMKHSPYVIGIDISYIKDKPDHAVSTAVLMHYNAPHDVIDYSTCCIHITNPYHAGYLAFRELDGYILAYQCLMSKHLDKLDQIGFVMLDGNGILHPQGFGLACHFGVITGLRTIGCAKNLHHIDGLDRKQIRQSMDNKKTDQALIVGKGGFKYGVAIRQNKNPVYLSPGNLVNITDIKQVIPRLMIVREPEPTRNADRISRSYIRENNSKLL